MKKNTQLSTESLEIPSTPERSPKANTVAQAEYAVSQAKELSLQEAWHRFCELNEAELACFGLSSKKIENRGCDFKQSDNEPGKFIVSIERHRAICNSLYSRGQRMAAYETYMQRLIFDPATLSLSELDEIVISRAVDAYALAHQMLDNGFNPTVSSSTKEGMRRVSYENSPSDTLVETDSVEIACKCLAKDLGSIDYEDDFKVFEDSQRMEYSEKMKKHVIEMAVKILQERWEDFDPDDD